MENLNIKTKDNKKSLKESIKLFFKGEFFQNKIVRWSLASSLLLNIANWAILRIFLHPVDLPIILHYNVYFGVDMMGNWKKAFILPSIGLIILAINFFLALYFFQKKERIAAHILLFAALMAQLSLIIASISVIIINY